MDTNLGLGIKAAQAGDFARGRALLAQAVRENPDSDLGWLWLGRCLAETRQREYCFRRALAVNPMCHEAEQELHQAFQSPPATGRNAIANESARPLQTDVQQARSAEPNEITPSARASQPGINQDQPVLQPESTNTHPMAERKRKKKFSAWDAIAIMVILLLGSGVFFFWILPGIFRHPAGQSMPGLQGTLDALFTKTPTLTPRPPPVVSMATLQATGTKYFPSATPTLDDTSNSLFFYGLSQNLYDGLAHEHDFDTYLKDVKDARQDIDQAIALRPGDGDYYYLRYEIYDAMASVHDLRADRDYFESIALDNLRTAVALGNSDKFSNRTIPLLEFVIGQCDGGLVDLHQIEAARGVSAPPNPSLLNLEANGYVCAGQFDKALEYIDQSSAIDPAPELEWLRAIVLYQLGRKDDALSQLNDLIAAQPAYQGYRYYLRALIYYEKGQTDLAEQDLLAGSMYTWGQEELKSYIMGLMAMDAGNNQEAIQDFQDAQATLDWFYTPTLLKKIDQKLLALDAGPASETPEAQIAITPLPTLAANPEPQLATPQVNSKGNSIPSNLIVVNMSGGTGTVHYGVTSYPVFLFQPSEPVTIQSVQNLALNVSPNAASGDCLLKAFLWDPNTGEWVMFTPVWGGITIDEPARFVDALGNIILAMHFQPGSNGVIKDIWLQMTAVDNNGKIISLGGNP